jgi:Fasciclin domain
MDSNATGNRESQGNPKDQGKPEDSVSPGKSQASAPTSTSSDPGPAAKPEQSGSSSKPQAAGSARTAQGPCGPGKTQDTVASGDASKAQENRAKYLKPLGRLAKYLALVIMVLILVRLVFDCYSFYIARRDIDAELQSKRVSSLEYLNLLSQRARALALSTLEARCLERAQLTLFRIAEVENDAIQKAYAALVEKKNAMIKALNESGLDNGKVEKVVEYVNGTQFELFKLDERLKELDDGGSPELFKKLKEGLEALRKEYIATALTHAPLRERILRIMQAYQAYGELIAQKNAMIKILNESGLDPAKVRKVTDYIEGSDFELSQFDEQIKMLEDGAGNSDNFKKFKARLEEQRQRQVDIVLANAPLRERIEQLLGTYPPTTPSFWTMDAIKTVVARIDQLRDERKAIRERYVDIDEVLARYAVWTNALTGGTVDKNPVLDDVAYQVGSDDARVLRDTRCDRFKEYYAAVNGRLLKADLPVTNSLIEMPAAAYRVYYDSLAWYFNKPPAAQTLLVTLLLGALGAVTLNALRMSRVGWWSNHPDPLWGEIVVGPLLGALAAFGIFLVGSAGLLLASDARGAQPLSTYFIGLLGFVSGLLYDEAFGRVRRVGTQIFAEGAPDADIAKARDEDRTLAEALKGASAARAASLVLKYGIGIKIGMETEFTLLAPSDEAIGELTVAKWNQLNEDRAAFDAWYNGHYADKRVSRADVPTSGMKELVTTDGKAHRIENKGDVLTIDGIAVVVPDVKWNKGIVHVLKRDIA